MQLNSIPNSKLRVLSGVVIGIVSIAVSFAPPMVITLFLTVLLLLCSYEFSTFLNSETRNSRLSILFLSIVGGVVGYFNPIGDLLLYLIVLQCLVFVALLYLPKIVLSINQLVLGSILYPGLCLGMLAHYLSENPQAYPLLLFFFTLIWASDTGGYYFGKNFGKHKLLESVSPKKTIEGLLGGGFVTVLCSVIWSYFYSELQLNTALFVGLITWLGCSYGDLVQSKLKRRFGVKDSSNLIPGHGGFFDRFDGFIFAAPFFVITHYLAA